MVYLIRVCVQIWDHLGNSKKNGGRLGGHFPGWGAVNLNMSMIAIGQTSLTFPGHFPETYGGYLSNRARKA